MMCGLSALDQSKLEAIRTVEQQMGKTILAYTCHELTPADLNAEELAGLRKAEENLGVCLVAVKS